MTNAREKLRFAPAGGTSVSDDCRFEGRLHISLGNPPLGFLTSGDKLTPMLLTRRTSSNGVVYYASPLLEQYQIAHAFSTRIGGVSPPPFDSMNLGNPNGCPVQDDTDRIAANYRRLMAAIGCDTWQRFFLHQVHGAQVSIVDRPDFSNGTRGDALVTAMPGIVLSVRVADCCPVLVSTTDGRAVAAIHAGWRGAVGGAVNAAVLALRQVAGIDTHQLIAAVGPCIGYDAFEVGPEVLLEFEEVFEGEAPIRRDTNGKGHVDLAAACRLQLLRSGLLPDRIDITDCCTNRDEKEFFSHRRDHGVTGRMAALIATRL